MLLRLTLHMLPPTNMTLSPPTSKTHQVYPTLLPPTTKRWQPNATRTKDPPKNMSTTPYVSWHNRSVLSWNKASLGPKTKPLRLQNGTKPTSNTAASTKVINSQTTNSNGNKRPITLPTKSQAASTTPSKWPNCQSLRPRQSALQPCKQFAVSKTRRLQQ